MDATRLPTEEPLDDEDADGIFNAAGVVVHQNDGDDDEYGEAEGLVQAEPLTRDEFSVMSMDTSFNQSQDYYHDDDKVSSFRYLVLTMGCVLLIALLAVLLPGIRNKSDALEILRTPARGPVEYHCKSGGATAEDDQSLASTLAENYNPSMSQQYEDVTNSITNNMTEFLDTFRESHFDDWGKTYNEVKQEMFDFKSKYYPPYLQDGSTIYESACGIGLNLYMTLEILQETKGIEELFVYGNELLEVSADKANAVFDHIAPAHGRKGKICPGDSKHLDFVPSNAFDLVYTGYVSPLLDPLKFGLGTNENFERYTYLCKSDPEELWAEGTLRDIAQQRQNDWYGEWVAEMARIAKPGVPVIVEQVSPQYCDAFFDWGGVHREWWHEVAKNDTYGWNIDPESVVIEEDTIFRDRYHVFMLKNGKREVL